MSPVLEQEPCKGVMKMAWREKMRVRLPRSLVWFVTAIMLRLHIATMRYARLTLARFCGTHWHDWSRASAHISSKLAWSVCKSVVTSCQNRTRILKCSKFWSRPGRELCANCSWSRRDNAGGCVLMRTMPRLSRNAKNSSWTVHV